MNKEKPLVYKLEEGKYMIDVAESFKRNKEAKEEKN
jgi:predicted  nucleic acid-binding Zn-ribbon protein